MQTGDSPGRLQMPAVTISEAAKALGFKSRSTLYRLRDDGHLAAYLRPDGPTGRQLLELAPAGLPPLREHIARFVRAQVNNDFGERQRAPRIDPRWEEVAGALTEALAEHGALQLCGHEAKALAEALPNALAAFGWEQLDALRVALADMGLMWAGPGTDQSPNKEGRIEFWREYGKWEPETTLNIEETWENVCKIAGAMLWGQDEQMPPAAMQQIYYQIIEAAEDVRDGARWDQCSWDNASVASLLEDPEVGAGECLSSLPELAGLAARGNLSPGPQAQADAALANYRKNKQEAAALPVVLS